jgi:hypothetical protein
MSDSNRFKGRAPIRRSVGLGGRRSQIVSLQPFGIRKAQEVTESLKMLVARGVFAAEPMIDGGQTHRYAPLFKALPNAATRYRDLLTQKGGE